MARIQSSSRVVGIGAQIPFNDLIFLKETFVGCNVTTSWAEGCVAPIATYLWCADSPMCGGHSGGENTTIESCMVTVRPSLVVTFNVMLDWFLS